MLVLSRVSDRPACASQNHWRQWLRGQEAGRMSIIQANDWSKRRSFPSPLWRAGELSAAIGCWNTWIFDWQSAQGHKLTPCKAGLWTMYITFLLPVATASGKGAQRSKRLGGICCRNRVHWTHHSSGKQMISFFAWLSQDSCLLPFPNHIQHSHFPSHCTVYPNREAKSRGSLSDVPVFLLRLPLKFVETVNCQETPVEGNYACDAWLMLTYLQCRWTRLPL